MTRPPYRFWRGKSRVNQTAQAHDKPPYLAHALFTSRGGIPRTNLVGVGRIGAPFIFRYP